MTGDDRTSNEALIGKIKPWSGVVPAGYLPTCFGSRTSVFFWAHWLGRQAVANALARSRYVETRRPTFGDGESFFEHANIMRSILRDRPSQHDRFIVVELGGGNGPRAVDSALALRQLRPDLKPFLVVLEALPTYVDWCRHHFTANGLDPNDHWIVQGIVSSEPIPALFFLQPRGFGNQMADASVLNILESAVTDRSTAVTVLERLAACGVFIRDGQLVDGRPRIGGNLADQRTWTPEAVMETVVQPTSMSEIGFVSALTLPSVLAPLPYVDFMDVDIQYAEIKVIPPHLDLLKKKVRLLSIGTHSKEIHADLLALFRNASWEVINDIEPYAHHVQGNESFDNHDGVLTVQNVDL
jgi:hypothetical protein